VNEFNPLRWTKLWGATATPVSEAIFARLATRHAEPHRHYHNAQHVAECLVEFDRVAHNANSSAAVEAAIWFHDAVYDPPAADNEERSAELAQTSLRQLGAKADLIDAVMRLVLATKKHDVSLHPDASLMVDVDLSILGQDPDRFWEYENQIRAEYDWVPAATFATKRAEILEGFLARPRIYNSEAFFHRFEAKARDNLRASIKKLRGG